MNAFYEHHKDSIRFGYRCFDRVPLNGLIQPFQQPERVIGFFNAYRHLYPVSRDVLREIASQFQNWVVNRSQKWGAPVLEAPEDRRDKFLDPYFRRAKPNQVVAIVKGREPARIMIAIGNKKENRWHLQIARRAALDRMGERLLDANRTIGQPNKITVIFGRKIAKQYRGKLQTVIDALEASPNDYSLACLRYDLSKLRAKGLVEKVPRSRRYRLLREGYSVCLVFLKLFERIYAPLTAGLLSPVSADSRLQQQKRSQLDRLYQRVVDDLGKLMEAVGLKAA